jgi:hypothetical protein
MLRLYLYARVRFLRALLHTRPRVQQAPGIPRALFSLGGPVINSSGASRRETAESYSVSSPGLTGRPSIPEAAVIEPISRGVLDTRIRGYDDVLCGEWIASAFAR